MTTTTTTTTHFLSRPIRDLRLRTSLNDTTDETRDDADNISTPVWAQLCGVEASRFRKYNPVRKDLKSHVISTRFPRDM